MKQTMHFPEDVAEMISKGKKLLLAGDERLLSQLPNGNWIGGTTQYFMTKDGAISSTDKIMVTELPDYISSFKMSSYDEDSIKNVYSDAFENGVSFIIVPSSSKVHFAFALNAPSFPNFAMSPLIGWLSAVSLTDTSNRNAKTFLGTELSNSSDKAMAMHVELPKNKYANIEVINGFRQGDGDTIEFSENGFNAKEAIINGVPRNLGKYLAGLGQIIQLPLVADYCGTMVNVSVKVIDPTEGTVEFYAPVFKKIKYKLAVPSTKHPHELVNELTGSDDSKVAFSCNCVLNYIMMSHEEKASSRIEGPVTFGEIAYQLLNQTYVHVEIKSITDQH